VLYHDCPWRATADLVRGRVPTRDSAGLLALSRYTVILERLLCSILQHSCYLKIQTGIPEGRAAGGGALSFSFSSPFSFPALLWFNSKEDVTK